MNSEPKTFECAWCKDAFPDDPNWYTHSIEFIGGHDAETGRPICDGCAEAGEPVDSLPEFIGVELEPGMIVHVTPNVSAGTLEALREMMHTLADQLAQEKGDAGK